MPRIVGPMVSNYDCDTNLFELIGLKSLGDGDDLFANLLLPVDVTTAKILRVVEVPGTRPQFTHLVADAFQYDSKFDLFLIESAVLANPFRTLPKTSWLEVSVAVWMSHGDQAG